MSTSADIQNNTIQSIDILDNTIASADILDNTIQGQDILNETNQTQDIQDNTITFADMGDNSVGTVEIIDNSVTSLDLMDNGVASIDIMNGTIAQGDMAANSIGTAQIIDGSVNSADITDNSVATNDILNNTILSEDIADNTVSTADILDNTVGSADITDNSVASGPTVPSLLAPECEIGNRQPIVQLTFDRLMAEASVAAAISVSPTIPYHTTWVSHTLTITPAQPLTPGQTYTFSLDQTATDQNGLPLAQRFGWEIHMPATLKDTSHLYDVDKGEAIVIYFNYAVDPASFNLSSNPALPGELSWNSAQTVFSYTLTTRPVGSSQYVLTLEPGLRDPQGGSLPLPYSLFTMKTASRISVVSPTHVDHEISPITPITIQFKQPMNQASVAAAFRTTPTITGTITWNGNVFTFQPSEGRLAGDTQYTVSLDATATDAEGYPIQSTVYSWQFTTGPDEQLVSFGYGEHNQVLNLRGRRAVQYSFPYGQQPLPVRFDLYRLSLEQWLAGHSGTFVQSWDETPTPPSEYYVHIQETILPDTLTAGSFVSNASNIVSSNVLYYKRTNELLTEKYSLEQNYPNPFNPSTSIS